MYHISFPFLYLVFFFFVRKLRGNFVLLPVLLRRRTVSHPIDDDEDDLDDITEDLDEVLLFDDPVVEEDATEDRSSSSLFLFCEIDIFLIITGCLLTTVLDDICVLACGSALVILLLILFVDEAGL